METAMPDQPERSTPAPRRARRRLGSLLASGALAAGLLPLTLAATAGTAHAAMNSGDVQANLFEWNWNSVAKECTTVLGPDGYGGVQVAPPEDSLSRSGHPWWEVYQPVDYNLTSRMGNETDFKNMVSTCRAAGVKVYVDAVLNHMTGQGSTSYGGVSYSKYSYPGLYSSSDFHYYPADCPESDDQIHNWNDYTEVTHCELDDLADLQTGTDYVRGTEAAYLNKLLSYGVSGFRVDAAKHIGETDLAAIESKLTTTVDGTAPSFALEVVPGGSGQLAPASFEGQGRLLGFDYADAIKSDFTGDIANLSSLTSGLLGSSNEVVFVQNHDTERDGSTLSYKDGATDTLATEFMLAYGYGTPQVYSSFDWTNSDDSPPSDANGYVSDTACGSGWECLDRATGVAGLVAFHNATSGQAVANWSSPASNVVAFSRGGTGWIGLNNTSAAVTYTFTTGLPAGTYCDIVHGTVSGGSCSGPMVAVGSGGQATVTIPAKDAVAFDTADAVTAVAATFDPTVTTWYGQNVYVVGSIAALGGWDTSKAVPLSSANYPVWSATIALPPNTYLEYKYIKKDPDGTIEWESGSNRTATTPASGSATYGGSWQ
jgi:alpha-amylase